MNKTATYYRKLADNLAKLGFLTSDEIIREHRKSNSKIEETTIEERFSKLKGLGLYYGKGWKQIRKSHIFLKPTFHLMNRKKFITEIFN